MIDVIINFLSAYCDEEDNLVTDRWVNPFINIHLKKISYNYLTGWFFIDLISSFPFSVFLGGGSSEESDDTNRYNNLVRVARMPRLYKMIKMTKYSSFITIKSF